MEPYSLECVPGPFGLTNTGVICYFNSFMQSLMSCPAFIKAVKNNQEYVEKTETGRAVNKFINGEHNSSHVLRALMVDLSIRKPHIQFGVSQESASESLILLLDMMELPQLSATTADATNSTTESTTSITAIPSPITNIFQHRFRCDVHCRKCNSIVSKTTDYAVNFNLFHIDSMQIDSEESFSKAIKTHVSSTEDFVCEKCKEKTTAFRVYKLAMIPEVMFCMFNIYGRRNMQRYFPKTVSFPATTGGKLVYKIVAQVEHVGSLHGGHYWARGLRNVEGTEKIFLLNDTSVSASDFEPTPSTYIVVYHYSHQEM